MYVELKVTGEDVHANSVVVYFRRSPGGRGEMGIKLRETPNDACQSLSSFPATYPELHKTLSTNSKASRRIRVINRNGFAST